MKASKPRAEALAAVQTTSYAIHMMFQKSAAQSQDLEHFTHHYFISEEVADESQTIILPKTSRSTLLHQQESSELQQLDKNNSAQPQREKKKKRIKKVKKAQQEGQRTIYKPKSTLELTNIYRPRLAIPGSKTPVNKPSSSTSNIKSFTTLTSKDFGKTSAKMMMTKSQVTPFLLSSSQQKQHQSMSMSAFQTARPLAQTKQSTRSTQDVKSKQKVHTITPVTQNNDPYLLSVVAGVPQVQAKKITFKPKQQQAKNLDCYRAAKRQMIQAGPKTERANSAASRPQNNLLICCEQDELDEMMYDLQNRDESGDAAYNYNQKNSTTNQIMMRQQKQSSPTRQAQLGSKSQQRLANVQTSGQPAYPAYLQNQLEINQRDSRQARKVQTAINLQEQQVHQEDILNSDLVGMSNTNAALSKKLTTQGKKKKTITKPVLGKSRGLSRHASSSSQGSAALMQQQQQVIQFHPQQRGGRYQEDNSEEMITYNTTQTMGQDNHPQASAGLRQETRQEKHKTFDYRQHIDSELQKGNVKVNQGRNQQLVTFPSAGQAREALLNYQQYHKQYQNESSHNQSNNTHQGNASLPRQLQDTGQARPKQQHRQTGGDHPQPYLSPHKHANASYRLAQNQKHQGMVMVSSKALRQQQTSSNTMLSSKKMEDDEPNTSKSGQSFSAQKRNNIFVRGQIYDNHQVANQSPEPYKINNSNFELHQPPRMPFELAHTVHSQDSTNQTPISKAPQNSLAQKMNHMVTAENDLSRKSISGKTSMIPPKRSQELAVDCIVTDRSVDLHHKPDQPNNMPRNHHISAKIPAKVKPSSRWQQMQSVSIQANQGNNNSQSSNPNSRLKHNMQIYSMPKRAVGAFEDNKGASGKVKLTAGNKDVDNVAINVAMQASKGKLYSKRQSQPVSAATFYNRANNMPLANKYAHLGGASWQNKEPNKFPSSSQSAQKVQFQHHHKAGQQLVNRQNASGQHDKQADMTIDKEMAVAHPLLSKSQSGAKKRPSMYAIPIQEDEYQFLSQETDSLNNASFSMMQKPNEERSASYIGRLKNFLGFNQSQATDGLDQSQFDMVRVGNVRDTVILNEGQAMSPAQPVPKLVLKELQQSDDYEPVSSQKFESPKETKQLSSHRFKCSCEPSSEPYACSSAFRWLQMANGGRKFDITPSRKSYLDLLGIKDFISMAEERQIECDITRTFPQQKIFQEPSGEGQQSLQRVLQAFSKYDACIGYVQGMNFIVGALLLHCSEEVTFWLFVALIEDYEMRDIYMEGLPGHIKHSTLITQLMENHLPEMYDHFQEIGMNIEIFATDWYFTLFAKVIPTYQMNAFFDSFFEFGWCFFHKFTLTLLRILNPQIMQMDDMSEIKQLLLLPKHKQNFYGNSGSQSVINNTNDRQIVSDVDSAPFSQSDQLDGSSTAGSQPQSRTFLTSIGNLFGFRGSDSDLRYVDKELDAQVETGTVEELLRNEDAWIQIIDISKRLWGKKLPDSAIIQYLHEYDELQEQQLTEQLNLEAKFHDSDQDKSTDLIKVVRESSPLIKAKKGVTNKKLSDSPLPKGGSFSSNELEDDNIEHPTNEMSPMKHVHDSGKRMPKQTKLMFKNMDELRQGTHQSPKEIDNRNSLAAQALEINLMKNQFAKSSSNTQMASMKDAQDSEKRKHLLSQKREQTDLPMFGGTSSNVTGFQNQERPANNNRGQAFLAAAQVIHGKSQSQQKFVTNDPESPQDDSKTDSKQKARKYQYLNQHQADQVHKNDQQTRQQQSQREQERQIRNPNH